MLTCYFAMRMIKDKVKRSFSLVSGHSLFEGVYRLNIPLNEKFGYVVDGYIIWLR